MAPACASLLLAAGGSLRLGYPKQLIKVDGESLLRRTARLAVESGCLPNFVVLGAFAERLRPELQSLPVTIVENAAWEQGIATSIRRGMEELRKALELPERVLLLVCDQPRLNAAILQVLLEMEGVAIAASRYQNSFGVPAVFSRRFFPELAALSGDAGARRIIAQNSAAAGFVDFPEGDFDIDTPTDVTRLDAPPRK